MRKPLDVYRRELKTAQSGLNSWQVERDKCYVERDAFHTNGVLEAHIAASEQSFCAYEEQYPTYLAARQRMIDAQTSVGYTHVVFPHGSEPPEPGTLPRY